MDSPRRPTVLTESGIQLPPLWLVGLMACGKSATSKALEEHWFQWIDMDTLITEQRGMTISEIFDEFTATGFRLIEEATLHHLSREIRWNTVVATGGGAPCFFRNMRTMNNSGVTVFLDGEPEFLADRTITDEMAGKPSRPLVKGMGREQRIQKFQELDTQRRPFYEQSHVKILISGKSVGDIVREIFDQCKSR